MSDERPDGRWNGWGGSGSGSARRHPSSQRGGARSRPAQGSAANDAEPRQPRLVVLRSTTMPAVPFFPEAPPFLALATAHATATNFASRAD